MKKDDVTFHSSDDDLVIGIKEEQNLSGLREAFKKKFSESGLRLPKSSKIIVDVGDRDISSKAKKEITRMVKKYSGGSTSRISWRHSKAKGQLIFMDKGEEIALGAKKGKKEIISATKNVVEEKKPPVTVPDEVGEEQTLLIKRTLRSGQSIHFDGNVVIMGDVNPGAEVVASGSIVVMGSFRGIAHAGVMGSENAIVTAFRLQPTQLRIANHITRAPDGEYMPPDQPEIARIKEGVVMIEAYQTNLEKQTKIG